MSVHRDIVPAILEPHLAAMAGDVIAAGLLTAPVRVLREDADLGLALMYARAVYLRAERQGATEEVRAAIRDCAHDLLRALDRQAAGATS